MDLTKATMQEQLQLGDIVFWWIEPGSLTQHWKAGDDTGIVRDGRMIVNGNGR